MKKKLRVFALMLVVALAVTIMAPTKAAWAGDDLNNPAEVDLVNDEPHELGGGSETYYRTMSTSDYDYLRMTNEVPSTNETFISPTQSFSSNYNGTTVKFNVTAGTTQSLLEIGVSNNTSQVIKDYGVLPQVSSGWNSNSAFFKGEGLQTNIGLGQGRALEIFNSNIISFEVVEAY